MRKSADLNFFLNGPNFTWNGITITMLLVMAFLKSFTERYIFQLTKSEHKGVSESIASDERNFFSVKPQTNFSIFLNWNILFLECSKISDILTLFEYILRIKIKNKCENEDDLDLLLNGPNFMWNGIIITMLLVMTFFKVIHQMVYLSVNKV